MPPPNSYKSPVPPLGVVLWATNPGSSQWFPAIVTERANGAISVMVIPSEAKGGMPKDSVLHKSDPRFAQLMDQSSGVWDYTEETKLIHLLKRIAIPDVDGNHHLITREEIAFANRLVK
jgi:hypothetical protein